MTPADYGPAGGTWTPRQFIALTLPALTFGLVIAGQATERPDLFPLPYFAGVIVPAALLVGAWPRVAKVARQVTRDARSVARFVTWRAQPNVTTSRAIAPLARRARAVVILPFILGRNLSPRVVMVPVHAESAIQMMSSSRPVLIRRRPVHADYVLLYETAPVSRVIAIAKVGRVETSRPGWLAAMFGARMDLAPVAFDAYLVGRDVASAVELERVYPLPVPLTVADATGHTTARERVIEGAHLETLRDVLAPADVVAEIEARGRVLSARFGRGR